MLKRNRFFINKVATASTTATTTSSSSSSPSISSYADRLALIDKCVKDAPDALPHQGILQNFVHHNPLINFEELHFDEAQHRLCTYQSYNNMNDRCLLLFGVDPRKRSNEALSELSSAFLDLGAAKMAPPAEYRERGFLYFFAKMEHLGFAPWRKHARKQAKRILEQHEHVIVSNKDSFCCDDDSNNNNSSNKKQDLAKVILEENLRFFAVPEEEWQFAVRAMLRDLRGWAGMFYRMEHEPCEAPADASVRLLDFAAVLSILNRASVSATIRDVLPGSEHLWNDYTLSSEATHNNDANNITNNNNKNLSASTSTSRTVFGEVKDSDISKWLAIAPKWKNEEEIEIAANTNSNHKSSALRHPSSNVVESKNSNGSQQQHTLDIFYRAASSILPSPTLKHIVEEKQKEKLHPHTIYEGVDVDEIAEKEDTTESNLAFLDQTVSRRDYLEREYKHTFLTAIGTQPISVDNATRPAYQFFTCMDDREGSFRRYLESGGQEKSPVETFGVAGFFALPIYYRPLDGREESRLAPVGNIPKYTLVEKSSSSSQEQQEEKENKTTSSNFFVHSQRRRLLANLQVWYEKATFFPPTAVMFGLLAWPVTAARLFLMCLDPVRLRQMRDQYIYNNPKLLPPIKTDFDIPFPLEEAAEKVGTLFNDIGLKSNFARLVTIIGHGATSANNPYESAYCCGACSGKEGGPNARLFARVANHPQVRELLKSKYNINVPQDTYFMGAVHNTTNDIVDFLDIDLIPETHREEFIEASKLVDKALEKNALERCDKFLIATTPTHHFGRGRCQVTNEKEAIAHVFRRSCDPSEVRPELNHSTNVAVVIGRRQLTRGRFLDRRAFLSSYDPNNDDDKGTNLEHVIAPALVVCSGINLEYLFSTIKGSHLGAGTKAPLNVTSLVGVLQGVNGDLRCGLPSQMSEFHTPIRSIFIIDAPIARIEAVLERRPDLARLVRNHWVHLIARDPSTNTFHMYRKLVPDQQNKNKFVAYYEPVTPEETRNQAFKLFERQKQHGIWVTEIESLGYKATLASLVVSFVVPSFFMFDPALVQTSGRLIALCTSLIAVPVVTFACKYLHGEKMFLRYCFLTVMLVLGFNIVATAPTLLDALGGWSLFGFASTFLIGTYNDRPTVRNNATFAFAAYRLGDTAFIIAVAMASMAGLAIAGTHMPAAAAVIPGATSSLLFDPHAVAAFSLIVASFWKMSQWPMTAIFSRSMEGPTPASALGYGGLSAHFGVVLLANFAEIWSPFPWAHLMLTAGGLTTAFCSTLVSWVRSDRKGQIAYANSATVGLILVVLAQGYTATALFMCLGNATIRITQILRAPSAISDTMSLRAALGIAGIGKRVSSADTSISAGPWFAQKYPRQLYRLAWSLRRFDTDFHLVQPLHVLTRRFQHSKFFSRKMSRNQQYLATIAVVVFAGLPYTPWSHYWEHLLIDLFQTHPVYAMLLSGIHFAFAVIAMRVLFWKVLNINRFK